MSAASPAAWAVVAAAAAGTALSMPLIIRLATRRGWMDVPDGDPLKIHGRAVPRVGGLAILVGLVAGAAAAWWSGGSAPGPGPRSAVAEAALWAAPPVLALAVLGFVDDRRGVRPAPRLAVETLAGVMAAAALAAGAGAPTAVGLLLVPVFAVGGVNALNMQDGRDGLAGGCAAISCLGVLVSAGDGNADAAAAAAIGAGAATGFLAWNRPPARVFLGDCGAYVLGFLAATAAAIPFVRAPSWSALAGSILLVGLPVADAAFAVARRVARGVSPFSGDRDHMYDIAARRGAGPWTLALGTWAVQAILVALGAGLHRA